MMKGFHASSLASALSCLLRVAGGEVMHRANELLMHKYKERGDAEPILGDVMPLPLLPV